MIGDALFIFLGLAVLLVGGDLLVRGAVGIAGALRVPALIISLTIIAFGTSAPELVVSVAAVLEKQPGIAVGNIVGSNIANILLVLGLPALAFPMATRVDGLRRHGVVLLIATAAFAGVAYSGVPLGRGLGAAFIAGIIAYIALLAALTRGGAARDPVIDEVAEYSDGGRTGLGPALAYLACGLIGLPLGADILVVHGSMLAASFGARPEVIGLTIVALGACNCRRSSAAKALGSRNRQRHRLEYFQYLRCRRRSRPCRRLHRRAGGLAPGSAGDDRRRRGACCVRARAARPWTSHRPCPCRRLCGVPRRALL